MGAYSELDIDRQYGDGPFEEGDGVPKHAEAQDTPAFTEAAPAAAPSAAETIVPQPQTETKETGPAPSASAQAADPAQHEGMCGRVHPDHVY